MGRWRAWRQERAEPKIANFKEAKGRPVRRASRLASSCAKTQEDGDGSSPPRKKQRVAAAAVMQATNGCYSVHNGDETGASSAADAVSPAAEKAAVANKCIASSRTEQDIIRLIGQHLRGLGLK